MRSRTLSLLIIMALVLGFTVSAQAAPTLSFWHFETPPPRPMTIQKGMDEFEKETGIKVAPSAINFPNYYPKLMSAVAADHLPDMAWVDTTHFASLMEVKALAPIDDIFKAVNDKDPIQENIAKLYQQEGHQYAIPAYAIAWPMGYRQDLYKAKGLAPPSDWALLEKAAKVLNDPKKGIFGMSVPYSIKGRYGGQVAWPFVRGAGGRIVDFVDGKWKVVFNSPETVKAYAFLAKLAKYTPPGSSDMDWSMATRYIMAGQAGSFMYTPDWAYMMIKRKQFDLLEKYLTMPMPTPKPGMPQNPHTGYVRGLVVSKKAIKEGKGEAIAKYITWLYQPEIAVKYILGVCPFHFNPVSPGAAKAYVKDPIVSKASHIIDIQVKCLKTVELVGFVNGRLCPKAGALEASNLLGETLQKIVLYKMSPEQAVEWAHTEFVKVMSQ